MRKVSAVTNPYNSAQQPEQSSFDSSTSHENQAFERPARQFPTRFAVPEATFTTSSSPQYPTNPPPTQAPTYAQYAQYSHYAQQPEVKGNPAAGWALGLSIVGLVLTLTVIGIVVSWVFLVLGFVLALFALGRSGKAHPQLAHKGMSIWALVINIFGGICFAGIVGFFFLVVAAVNEEANLQAMVECALLPEDEQVECIDQVVEESGR
ncbi:hypothetical protein CKALI_06625 [Corynebacterium kalinowskii]|uniref:DUF4190 domain-containing protein n=1 Tax=Corynebacterium kalinowskii TaxID=2675216 RepID=A0A6B8VRF6_9CORY|nr:hypothetical protein CKALI_06625 [Corynebacterium kalinowskii]